MKTKQLIIILCIVFLFSCNENKTNISNTSNKDEITEHNDNESDHEEEDAYYHEEAYNHNEAIKLDPLIITQMDYPELTKRFYLQDEYLLDYFDAVDDEEDDYKLSEVDVEAILYTVDMILSKSGYIEKPSDSLFRERLAYVYGVDYASLDDSKCIKNRESYFALLSKSTGYSETFYLESEFRVDNDNSYFSKEYNLVSPFYLLPLLMKQTETGDLKIDMNDLLSDALIHINNYVFYASQASLTWLLQNEDNIYFLEDLVIAFAYDKEPKINKAILNKYHREYKSKQPNDLTDIRGLFAARDVHGNLKIAEGLMKYIADSTTYEDRELEDMLEKFTYSVASKEPVGRGSEYLFTDFDESERLEVAAYACYYIQQIYDKLKISPFAPAWPSASPLYMLRTLTQSDKLYPEIIKNNYYNLPGFEEMLLRMEEPLEGHGRQIDGEE